ncbi:MAG: hypothetical protein GY803_32585, partial [Chloroflexi bacterium]|nr:hypothetical protein [Chloroflexota bacterium]
KAGTVDDHLAAIADGLLAIIHTPAQQAFNDHLSASQHIANRLTNERGVGTVCSLGAYSVRMPLGPMEEALTWRLIYDLLFERELGLLPLLEMQPDGAYKEIEAEEITADNARERKAEATRLVDKYISRLNRADFGQAVARKISRLLNGEEGKHDNPLVNRIGGLLQAERWLGSLKSVVRREGEREVGHSIGLLAEQTTEWQTFLDESVRPFIANQWGQSRQQLAQFSAQHGRHWALTPELEWPIYKQRLRPTPKQTAELQRAAQRFGWYVHYHESSREWRIHLLAPPGDFVWANGAYIEQFSLERDRDAFVRHLYNLVYPLVHNKTESEYALDEADLLPVKQWLADAKPRLSVNELEASHFIETNEAIILVAPKSERATALKQKIQNVWQQSRIILCETQDKTAVTLLHLRDRVPLTAYEGYNEEAWQMNFVDSNLYVWQGEQIAAEIEPEPGRIDSAFRGWIEQDKQRLDLFGQAIIYGVLGNNKGEWELPGWGTWRGDGLGGAVANLFSADTTLWPKPLASPNRRAVQQSMDELAAAIAERRREIRENPEMGERAYLRQTQKELIDPLLNGKDVR